MPHDEKPLYAARLNPFKVGAEHYWPGKNRITMIDLLERAAAVDGLNATNLNFPDQFEGASATELSTAMASLRLTRTRTTNYAPSPHQKNMHLPHRFRFGCSGRTR